MDSTNIPDPTTVPGTTLMMLTTIFLYLGTGMLVTAVGCLVRKRWVAASVCASVGFVFVAVSAFATNQVVAWVCIAAALAMFALASRQVRHHKVPAGPPRQPTRE